MKRLILLLLMTLSLSCSPQPGDKVGSADGYDIFYAGELYGIKIYCNDECPDLHKLRRRLSSVYWMFDDHLPDNFRGSPSKFYKRTKFVIRFSKYKWFIADEHQIYGSYLNGNTIWIYYPYSCDCGKGLCGGILDYELGHVFMRYVKPEHNQDELKDLKYREKHNLLYSEDSKWCSTGG